MGRYVTRLWPPDPSGHEYGAYIPNVVNGWQPDLPRWVLDRVSAAERDIDELIELGRSYASYQWATDCIMAQGESLSSSAIEGIYSSLVGMSSATEGVSHEHDKAALRNWDMCEQTLEIIKSGEHLTLDDLLELHAILMGDSPIPGHLRTGPVWIGGGIPRGMGPLNALFVPPPSEYVKPLLEDLIDYINYTEHSPILRAAITHAQFETIHPYVDGNGRTGRALIQVALFRDRPGEAIHLPISRWLENDRSRYYSCLQETHQYEGDLDGLRRSTCLESWVDFLSEVVQRSASQIRETAKRTDQLIQAWQVRLEEIRQDATVWLIIPELVQQPVFTSETMLYRLGEKAASPAAIRRGIKQLQKAKIIREVGKAGNTRIYRADEIIDLAEDVLKISHLYDGSTFSDVETSERSHTTDSIARSSNMRSRTSSAAQVSLATWKCGHIGTRSQKPCTRKKGHPGHHMY